MGVGEVMVSAQVQRVSRRVGPNDLVIGTVRSCTVLAPEQEEMPLGRHHAFSQCAGPDQAKKRSRGNQSHHGFSPRGVRRDFPSPSPRLHPDAYGKQAQFVHCPLAGRYLPNEICIPLRSTENINPLCRPLSSNTTPLEFLRRAVLWPPAIDNPACTAE